MPINLPRQKHFDKKSPSESVLETSAFLFLLKKNTFVYAPMKGESLQSDHSDSALHLQKAVKVKL